jgi:hypothetical protein
LAELGYSTENRLASDVRNALRSSLLQVILKSSPGLWEAKMVLRTTGANWLALMMRAERGRTRDRGADSEWLLHGPTDPDAVEGEDEVAGLLAAE